MPIKAEAPEGILIDRKLPAEFTHMIGEAKYNTLIDIVLKYYESRPGKLIKIESGIIDVKPENGEVESSYYFFNLIRNLMMVDVSRWRPMIYHFLSDKVNMPAHLFFFKDYEHARKYLKILIKPIDIMQSETMKDSVVREIIPGTVACLTLLFEEKFMFLQNSMISEWGVSVDELFEVALENTSRKKLHTRVCRLPGGDEYSIMMSRQYSAAQMLDPEGNVPDLVGEFGMIFGIPANGLVLATALHKKEDKSNLINIMLKMAVKGYRNEPSPITYDLFFYLNGMYASLLQTIKKERPDVYNKMFGRK